MGAVPIRPIKTKAMTYECKSTFSSINGTRFHKGETISLTQLANLPADERAYFRRSGSPVPVEDEPDDIMDAALDIGIGIALSSILSDDSEPGGSSDSGSSFDGFGGGDFGGGGASADY